MLLHASVAAPVSRPVPTAPACSLHPPRSLIWVCFRRDSPNGTRRVKNMVDKMEDEGMGACTNHAECQDACPKEISIAFISRMNRDYAKSASGRA